MAAASMTSSWILVAMTMQRALAVTWPHRVNTLCTVRRIRAVIAGIVVVFACFYAYQLYGWGIVNGDCAHVNSAFTEFLTKSFVIEIPARIILPCALLLISNVVMVIKLRETVSAAVPAQAMQNSSNFSSSTKSTRASKVNSVTLTALVVSLAYLVCELPLLPPTYLFNTVDPLQDIETFVDIYVATWVSRTLHYANSAVNFYLYCLTGRRFRRAFFNLIFFWRKGAAGDDSRTSIH
jgi:hypothetical protein